MITDPSGAVIPGAQVLVHGLDTGLDRTITSDSGGVYSAPSLQPGAYSVKISATGFGTFTVGRVILLVDQKTGLNAKLTLGETGTTVEVNATASLMDTDTITVGSVIDQETVQNIPLNGRHFLDLTNLTPGTVVPPVTGSLTVPSRGLGANSFNTAGAREDAINFMVNGVNLNDMSQNQITFQPSIDTTSSFKLDNSTYSAEYGRNSGAIVNVLTRSGTNQYHGNVFDYYRDQYFDARNYFNRTATTTKSTFRRQNYGADLSGPVFKDKTFLFLSYEALRQEQGLLFNHTVLTAAQRAALMASPAGPAYAQLANIIPVANDATGSIYTASSSAPVRVDQFSGDLLHKLTSKDTLHLYYAWQQDKRTEPNLQGNNLPGFGDHRGAHRQIGTINEVHVFTPTTVNEMRVGFSRIAISFTPNFVGLPATYGLNTGNPSAVLPQITVSDIGLNIGGPNGFPQGRFDTTGIISDTATLIRGKQTIKVGGEFRRFIFSSYANTSGAIAFPTTTAFINGLANSYSVTPQTVVFRAFNGSAAGFVDDAWKVTPRLLFEAGLRFEWNGTPVEAQNRFVNFLANSDTLQAVHTPLDQGYNFEPRVGLSYDLFGNGKTVIRSAFGILTDEPTDSVDTGLATNPPNAAPLSLTGAALPVGTLFTSATVSGLSPNATNPHFRDAYTESFNLNVEQALGNGTVVKVGYIGALGRHLRLSRNINQFSVLGTTARPYPTLSINSPVRPGSALGNITYQDSDSVSNYNAMWFTVQKNLAKGLQFNTTYTYAKSMDINSLAGGGLQDNTNPAGNYGLSDFDVRHHFVFSGTYALPFHKNRFVDGFLVAVINQEQTGNPLNLLLSNTSYTGTATLRPVVLTPGYSTGRGVTTAAGLVPFINATVCATATMGCNFLNQTNSFGTLQRNGLTGPKFEDTDASLQKTTKIAEGVSVLVRVDAFDIFNHVNFSNPNTTPSTSAGNTFGLISATRGAIGDAGSSRQLQFAAKLIF